jgi:hypothetical protein
MLVLCVSLAKHKRVVEENDLPISIFHHDEEGSRCTMDFLVPTEIGNDRQINTKERSRDRLNLGLQSARDSVSVGQKGH